MNKFAFPANIGKRFRNFANALKFVLYILFVLTISNSVAYSGESDSLSYRLFKDRVVLFADVGFHSAPFSMKDHYGLGVDKLKFKNNVKVALGFGFAYRWLGLRVGFTLPGNIRSKTKYGDTRYFDLGLKFNIKQTFCNIDFRGYTGYAIKDAYKWNDTLTSDTPNDIRPNTRSASISANVWWFLAQDFRMKAVLGKAGHFRKESKTWYFKTSLNFFGVANDFGSLVPEELADTSDRVNANTVGALDLGLIPGYAYGNRIKNWQFAIFAGLGGVIQSKFYTKGEKTRSFLGIAPRVDLRLIAGYSKPKFFVLLASDFDIKSAKIQDLSYNQTFYNIKLISGIRLHTKKSRQKENANDQSWLN